MKVRYLKGDDKGRVAYLDYHAVQAALQADPESLEIIDGYPETSDPALREAGSPADNAERGEVRRSAVAPADLSEEDDPTRVTTAGHGIAGADAQRVGSTVTHRAEGTDPGEAVNGDAQAAGSGRKTKTSPREQSTARSHEAAARQNAAADTAGGSKKKS